MKYVNMELIPKLKIASLNPIDSLISMFFVFCV
jgi:hypothetical protein